MGHPCLVISSSLPLALAHCFPTPKAHSECSMPSAASVPPLSSFFPDSLSYFFSWEAMQAPQHRHTPGSPEPWRGKHRRLPACSILHDHGLFVGFFVPVGFFLTNGFKTKGISPVNVIMFICLYKPTGIVLPISLLTRRWESPNTKAWRWKDLHQDAASSLKAKSTLQKLWALSDTIYLKEELF